MVAFGTDWTVQLRGAGPIRLGMTLPEVRRVIGDPKANIEGNEPAVPLNECAYLRSNRLPSGLGIMFENWRVVRIDVWKKGIRTVSGAAVEDTEGRVKLLHPGRITVEAHHYHPDGHYLNYSSTERADQSYGMVFETDGAKVTSIRTGTLKAIALVEGCS
ncbi:MAG: hypothetical protein JNM66_04855 [Bryobacterales bacterium]|nr:hypothetical protein [Bryobacterales bacterium]